MNLEVFNSELREIDGVTMMSSNTLASMLDKEHRFIVATIRNILESLGLQENANQIKSRFYIERGDNNSKTYWLDEVLSSIVAAKYNNRYALYIHEFFINAKNNQQLMNEYRSEKVKQIRELFKYEHTTMTRIFAALNIESYSDKKAFHETLNKYFDGKKLTELGVVKNFSLCTIEETQFRFLCIPRDVTLRICKGVMRINNSEWLRADIIDEAVGKMVVLQGKYPDKMWWNPGIFNEFLLTA